MPVLLSGVNLEDPKRLRDDLRQSGLPVGEWSVRCQSFVSPCEREPGVGHVLIRRSAWDRITDKTSLTLTFADSFGSSVSFVKLHPVSSPTPLAVPTATSDAILWLTLEDRRSRYKQVATSRSYNLRLAAGGWDTATLNSGTAFTWAQIIADLWAKLRAVYSDLPPSAPSLPSTPSWTPESFSFYSVDAWTALCTVCQAAGFLVRYDPTADVVSIINPADAVSTEPIQTQWSRTWDTRSGQLIPEAVPANFQLSFPRLGRPERHQISTTISESGVTTGATVTLPAYPSAAGDPVSNTTYLTAFTGRMRDFWRRDLAARSEPRSVQYKCWHPWVKTAVGLSGYASWGVSQLAGDEVQTSLTSGPLLVLPPGEPTPSLIADDTAHSYLLDVPCLVFSGGVAVGLAGVVVSGSGASAECVVKGACDDCGGGDLPPSPPPPVTATISGTVSQTGDAAGPVSGRLVVLRSAGTTATTNGSGNYSFTSVSGPALWFLSLVLDTGETATNVVDGGSTVSGSLASVYVTTTAHDADFTITPPSPPPPPPPPPTTATVNVTVQNAVGSAPLSGRTVTIGATSQTTNGSGQTSFTGVTTGSTNVVLTLGGGESASWSVVSPGASGKGATATFTTTAGSTHELTYQVSGVSSGGGE